MKQDFAVAVRGLALVAPHAGAWIETPSAASAAVFSQVAPPRGGVD